MQQALDFIRLRIQQVGSDLQVYKDLGPSYSQEETRTVAVLGELENLAMAIETFMVVNDARPDTPGTLSV